MKRGRDIAVPPGMEPGEFQRHVLRVRFAECLEKQWALESDDDEALHAFRLACKRLRYAIERDPPDDMLKTACELLAKTSRELGLAHDRSVLCNRARSARASILLERGLRDRGRAIRRARAAWHAAFTADGALKTLAASTGFSW